MSGWRSSWARKAGQSRATGELTDLQAGRMQIDHGTRSEVGERPGHALRSHRWLRVDRDAEPGQTGGVQRAGELYDRDGGGDGGEAGTHGDQAPPSPAPDKRRGGALEGLRFPL